MDAFEQRLAALRAAGEPTRLRLLRLLRRAELTVSELTRVVEQSQPGVSRHLRVLCDAELVVRHQEGAWAFYHARPSDLVEAACAGADGAVARGDDASLAAVLDERRAAALTYFARQAEAWDTLRAHYVANEAVEGAVRTLIGGRCGRLLDLGTGTGSMLAALRDTFDEAVGYDVSPEMLSVARVRLHEAEVTTARVRRGDLFGLAEEAGEADTVLMHHILHFLAAPDDAIRAAGTLLRPKGRLVVADFDQHDDETLREQHAHRRLGFSDQDIARYARRANLRVTRSLAVDPPEPDGLVTRVWLLRPMGPPPSTRSPHAVL